MPIKRKKKFHQQESDKFSGTVKEFVDLMQPALRLPAMVARGRWIIGQMLFVAPFRLAALALSRLAALAPSR